MNAKDVNDHAYCLVERGVLEFFASKLAPTEQGANRFPTPRRFTMQTTQPQRQRCEVWTRVMGYHRPVSAFNPGKQSEHRERAHFTESAAAAGRQ